MKEIHNFLHRWW